MKKVTKLAGLALLGLVTIGMWAQDDADAAGRCRIEVRMFAQRGDLDVHLRRRFENRGAFGHLHRDAVYRCLDHR